MFWYLRTFMNNKKTFKATSWHFIVKYCSFVLQQKLISTQTVSGVMKLFKTQEEPAGAADSLAQLWHHQSSEAGTQATLQQLCISCQYELWNRGFTLTVLTIPATTTAVPWEPGLLSALGFSAEGTLCKSCQHVRKHSKAAWPGSWTSDRCYVLDIGCI